MKKIYFLGLLLFNVFVCFGQNERDVIIHDSIYPILYNSDKYQKVKRSILDLEKKYGYEPELKHILINQSYKNNDVEFFKKEVKVLVREYGFQLIYLNGREYYYDSIIDGELSEWFKEMYLKNHFIWMKNNFKKQIDLKKLNEIRTKDQLVNGFSTKMTNELGLDSIQESKKRDLLGDFFLGNVSDINTVMIKTGNYPTGKNFALVQNSFGVAELHNLQIKKNIERFWLLFYPYYKKAYLKNDISFVCFKNYDNMSYVHYGNQRFGLLEVENIPEIFKKEGLEEVPIKDLDFYKSVKKEFKWN